MSNPIADSSTFGGIAAASLSTVPDKPVRGDSKEKIEDAARQFEALMITQLLQTMRESSGEGWMGTGEDQAGAQAMSMAEQHFAKALTASGGLGLARMIVAGLNRSSSNGESPTPNPASPPLK